MQNYVITRNPFFGLSLPGRPNNILSDPKTQLIPIMENRSC